VDTEVVGRKECVSKYARIFTNQNVGKMKEKWFLHCIFGNLKFQENPLSRQRVGNVQGVRWK
jgi:hypothetical protein